MDKKRIIDALIEKLETELATSRQSLDSVRRAVENAPGAMQSHSDTTRFQQARVAEELQRQLRQKTEVIALLNRFCQGALQVRRDAVDIGSLVEVEEHGQLATYLILPEGGGSIVSVDGRTVAILTGKAPLASAMMRHVAGDTVHFRLGREPERRLTVLGIG